jgi:hypothetical protein
MSGRADRVGFFRRCSVATGTCGSCVVHIVEDDPNTVKALVAAAKTGQFAHVLERARQDRDDAAQRAQARADLAATGVQMIEAPGCSGAAKSLGWQVCDAEGNELTAEQHAACPGHVGWVVQDWVTVDVEGRVYTGDELDALDDEQVPDTDTVLRWVPLLGCEDPDTYHPRPGSTAASNDWDDAHQGVR